LCFLLFLSHDLCLKGCYITRETAAIPSSQPFVTLLVSTCRDDYLACLLLFCRTPIRAILLLKMIIARDLRLAAHLLLRRTTNV
jgi:hypothetical protein